MAGDRVALFGEAERGEFCKPLLVKSLAQMEELLGMPPAESKGLECAIQALLFERDLLFVRVEEEGFSRPDYMAGLERLRRVRPGLTAICLPGVGDAEIIEATTPVCRLHQSLLLLSEADLYDYLTGC